MTWLIGNVTTEKLLSGEKVVDGVEERLRKAKTSPLSNREKLIGNKRCNELEFPKSCAGNKGELFTKPEVTLKNTHGWTEVS